RAPFRSSLVAETIQTSTGSERVPPSLRTARSSRAVSSLGCRFWGNSPISSRNSTPSYGVSARCRAGDRPQRLLGRSMKQGRDNWLVDEHLRWEERRGDVRNCVSTEPARG